MILSLMVEAVLYVTVYSLVALAALAFAFAFLVFHFFVLFVFRYYRFCLVAILLFAKVTDFTLNF